MYIPNVHMYVGTNNNSGATERQDISRSHLWRWVALLVEVLQRLRNLGTNRLSPLALPDPEGPTSHR